MRATFFSRGKQLQLKQYFCFVCVFLTVTNIPLSWRPLDLQGRFCCVVASWSINLVATQFQCPTDWTGGPTLMLPLLCDEVNTMKLRRQRVSRWVVAFLHLLWTTDCSQRWTRSLIGWAPSWSSGPEVSSDWSLNTICDPRPAHLLVSWYTWLLNFSLSASFVANFIWINRM